MMCPAAGYQPAVTDYNSLMSLAKAQGIGNETRGACKLCGGLGHLTKKCTNFLTGHNMASGADVIGRGPTGGAAAGVGGGGTGGGILGLLPDEADLSDLSDLTSSSSSDSDSDSSSSSSSSGSSEEDRKRRKRHKSKKEKKVCIRGRELSQDLLPKCASRGLPL